MNTLNTRTSPIKVYKALRMLLNRQNIRSFCTKSSSNSSENDSRQDPGGFDTETLRTKILTSSLDFAKEVGFTDDALSKGCIAHGLSPSSVGIFGRGPYDLVDFAMDKWYFQMKNELDDLELGKVGVQERLKIGVKLRLSYQKPYIEYWAAAMSLGIHPYYLSNTMYKIHKISDHLWFVAGDNSTDSNWYKKRAYLSTIYAATELYFIQDKSANFKDTDEFLHARINEMLRAGNTAETAQNMFVAASKGILSIASILAPEPSYKAAADEFQKLKDCINGSKQAQSGNKNDENIDDQKEGKK